MKVKISLFAVCLCLLAACEKEGKQKTGQNNPLVSEQAENLQSFDTQLDISLVRMEQPGDRFAMAERAGNIQAPSEQWEWFAFFTGFRGTIAKPEFKSIINIYKIEQESLAFYEVIVAGQRFSSGELDYSLFPGTMEGADADIELPHFLSQAVPNWLIHPMNTSFLYAKDTIVFTDGTVDGFCYFYAKTK